PRGRQRHRPRRAPRGRRHARRRRHDPGHRARPRPRPLARAAFQRIDPSVTAPPLVVAFDPSTPDASLRDLVRRAGPVATLTLDLGGGDDLEAVRERALGAGALRAHVIDARTELAAEVVRPALAAGALSPPVGPLVLALPVMARRLVDVARIEGATTIGHALDGANALVLERLVRSLAPDLTILGPGP